MDIKNIDRDSFMLDRNDYLDEVYRAIKAVELTSEHASDNSIYRTKLYCVNNLNRQIDMLKKTIANF